MSRCKLQYYNFILQATKHLWSHDYDDPTFPLSQCSLGHNYYVCSIFNMINSISVHALAAPFWLHIFHCTFFYYILFYSYGVFGQDFLFKIRYHNYRYIYVCTQLYMVAQFIRSKESKTKEIMQFHNHTLAGYMVTKDHVPALISGWWH